MIDNDNNQKELSREAKLALKYTVIREKILYNYARVLKYHKAAKIFTAVFFCIFTVIAVAIARHTGHKMLWLVLWVVLIFVIVGLSICTEYWKYLMEEKVVPYLEDDNLIDFGKYSIFENSEIELELERLESVEEQYQHVKRKIKQQQKHLKLLKEQAKSTNVEIIKNLEKDIEQLKITKQKIKATLKKRGRNR